MCQEDTPSSGRRGDPTDTDDRIERLRSAERMVSEAADIIDECLHMTDLAKRYQKLADELRSLASSNDTESIENLIRELEYLSEEQPGWTRPLASVKNVNIKDI